MAKSVEGDWLIKKKDTAVTLRRTIEMVSWNHFASLAAGDNNYALLLIARVHCRQKYAVLLDNIFFKTFKRAEGFN